MKKTLLTALVICASVCTAFAQDQKATTTSNPSTTTTTKEADQKATAAKQAQQWQELLETELKLTDDQQKKIAEMNKAFDERQQNMENNPEYTAEFKAERRAVLKKAREAQFLKLLTPEQQARYKELVEARSK